jgi:hypothetical protein
MSALAKYGRSLWAAAQPVVGHLLSGGGLPKEIKDLRADLTTAFAGMPNLVVEEWTDLEPGTVNAIKTAAATVATVASFSGASLNGAVGAAALSRPRRVTVTTAGATASDAPATALITGLAPDGVTAQTDTITVSQTAATATSTKFFSKVTQIDLPAADGTGATLAFGFSSEVLLRRVPVSRAGLAFALHEVAAGVLVTTGTISVANQSYTPASAPDGSKDYCIYYEAEPLT